MDKIVIDGRMGEGGGQILRSSLTLAMLYGKEIEINHIRGKRPKPGLMRQHLTCVKAAQAICGAKVDGAELGSSRLTFKPGPIKGGDYKFDVGSAGSTALVFQTVLLPLLQAEGASTVEFGGGTHNPFAPPLTEIERSFLPLLRDMGAKIEVETERWGFMPAGGGKWRIRIQPEALQPIERLERGELNHSRLTAYCYNIPGKVGEREVQAYLSLREHPVHESQQRKPEAGCAGNLLAVDLQFDGHRICLSELGQVRRRAELVSKLLSQKVKTYLDSNAVLDEHLTDQMMLPMLVAGGGRFSISEWSLHAQTNAEVIELFTSRKIECDGAIMWMV
ncbi:RNA 3'-terminal phosphate cyclase [Hahella sp. HN01]|uniref:RNA 3'-terminal phosphate cyclase n=1 Tax=Hahella sp. HN01 TaxID=2847262 RepID=UPI001C1EF814|nr:RNA 3'-terminal phosphate cyclase [Hahella sp. HN01]MBU6950331.1 RNA 3'-terminal phosphate cyclase [Hahella sp. HN01]